MALSNRGRTSSANRGKLNTPPLHSSRWGVAWRWEENIVEQVTWEGRKKAIVFRRLIFFFLRDQKFGARFSRFSGKRKTIPHVHLRQGKPPKAYMTYSYRNVRLCCGFFLFFIALKASGRSSLYNIFPCVLHVATWRPMKSNIQILTGYTGSLFMRVSL